ncbi:MAG: hypothetical protein CMP35_03530 [Rickettsiales bacterium]|nr:hypothetical protein [Rickettsiales bacterium]|tara:strand:+ start:91 stop:477 length:387 start_codon:yes stop_codon:yes gene_type:complete
MDSLNKKSVLIIDSDDNVLSALSSGLKSRSMLPITAKDGYDGYNRALKEKPDIILLEIILPTLDGFRITKLLKFDERYMDTYIILMSNNIENIDADKISKSGANGYLGKPFKFSDLIKKINEVTTKNE